MDEFQSKKLLILTTYFPPEAEIAAARLKNIIKHLLRLGWEIYCVATTDLSYDYGADEVLQKIKLFSTGKTMQVQTNQNKRKVKTHIVSLIKRLQMPPFVRMYIKSAIHMHRRRKWVHKAYLLSMKAIKSYGIGMVLATVPGVEAAFVGGKVKKKFKDIHFFCEYRDIISDNQIYKTIQSKSENRMIKKMEMNMLCVVNRFIYLTEGIKQGYMRYQEYNPAIRDGIVLTNGYDKESFPVRSNAIKKDNKLVISHIGHLYGSRSALGIVSAIENLQRENPQMIKQFCLQLIGKMDHKERSEILKICKENSLTNIYISEPVSHEQALSIMMKSDVNLIITHKSGSEYAIPGKLFEYMGARRPVMAISVDPLLVKIIHEENLGWTCPNEQAAIIECLKNIYEKWLCGALHSIDIPDQYEINYIVSKLDRFLLGK